MATSKIGEMILRLRNWKSWTQEDLAKNICGKDLSFRSDDGLKRLTDIIRKLENGEKDADTKVVAIIAEIFNVDPDGLIAGEMRLAELASTLERRVVNGFKDIKDPNSLPFLFEKQSERYGGPIDYARDEYGYSIIDYILKHSHYKTLCLFLDNNKYNGHNLCDVICARKYIDFYSDIHQDPYRGIDVDGITKNMPSADKNVPDLRRILIENDDIARLGKPYFASNDLRFEGVDRSKMMTGYHDSFVRKAIINVQPKELMPLLENPKKYDKIRKLVLDNPRLALMYLSIAVQLGEWDTAKDILYKTIKTHTYPLCLEVLQVVEKTKDYDILKKLDCSELLQSGCAGFPQQNDYRILCEYKYEISGQYRQGFDDTVGGGGNYGNLQPKIKDAKVIELIGKHFFSTDTLGKIDICLILESLTFNEVLKNNDKDLIKKYLAHVSECQKDLALNNYTDGDLEVVKILLESGAHFIIQGHSNPPTENEYTNGDSPRRDKTKTALTKLQLGIK